ncbi:PAP2 superfamily protein [Streptomyces aidingensis]|uniref:PAP2 superfamily protein n=2 Tax=Streptomyces aidingensis TaxID=910347 RepID=A0A1I1RHT2_9ACTN|nr:phosphatase PAP2 family protein [Streptomyces aidingensis]SFD33859.1 PAP2 superfamily protein [Streptomyces aidingensis]
MPSVRPRWWTELPLILLVYGAYSGARLLARGDVSTAVDNGLALLRLEETFWLHAEVPLNRLFTDHAWLGVPGAFFYAALHYLVTPAVLVWLFRRHGTAYRRQRSWLMVSTLAGLIGFTLMPTCPPRLLDPAHGYGFTDSLAQYSGWGWWSDAASAPSGLGYMTNQYAAMPSLHVGWALWCGVVLWRFGAARPVVRAAAVGYPVLTTVVVMGTANHYFLDAVAGVLVMGGGWLLSGPALRLADRARDRLGLSRAAGQAGPAGQAVPAGLAATVPGPRGRGGAGAPAPAPAAAPAPAPAPALRITAGIPGRRAAGHDGAAAPLGPGSGTARHNGPGQGAGTAPALAGHCSSAQSPAEPAPGGRPGTESQGGDPL